MDDVTKTSIESSIFLDDTADNNDISSKQTQISSVEPSNHDLISEKEVSLKANSSTDSDNGSESLLATNTSSLIQYDRDTLLRLRKSHSAELWPAALHRSHVGGDGLWDPVKSFDLTRAITPPERRRGGGVLLSNSQDERKRGGSSSERSRDDVIVLGPQKRSWASGCSSSFRGSGGAASGTFSGSLAPLNTLGSAGSSAAIVSDSSRGANAASSRSRVSSSGGSVRAVEIRRGNSNSFSRGDDHDDHDTVRYDSRTNATGGRARGGHRDIPQSRGSGRFDNLPRGGGGSGRNRSERESWSRSGARQSNGRYDSGGGFDDALPEWATCEGGPRDQYDTMEFQALPDENESLDKSDNSTATQKSKARREDRGPARRIPAPRTDKSVNGIEQKKSGNAVSNSESSVTASVTTTPVLDKEKKESVSVVNADLMDIDISDILPSGAGDKLTVHDEPLNLLISEPKDKTVTSGDVISTSSGYSRFSKWKANTESNSQQSTTPSTCSTITSNAEQCAQIQKFIMKEINSGVNFSRNESSIASQSAIDTAAANSESGNGSRLLINILQSHSAAPAYSNASKRTLSPSEASASQVAPGYSMDTKTMEANLRDLLLPSADRSGIISGGTSVTNSLHHKLGLTRAAAINGHVRTLEEIESHLKQQQTPSHSHSQQGPPGLMNGNDTSKLMSLQIPTFPQKMGTINPLSPSQSQHLSPSYSQQQQQTQVKPTSIPQPPMPIDQLQRLLMMQMAKTNPNNVMFALTAQRMALAAQQSGLPTAASGSNATAAAFALSALSQSGAPSGASFSGAAHNPATGALHAAQFLAHGAAAASPANNAGIGNRLLNSQAHQPDANSILQHFMAKQQMQNSAAAAAAAASAMGGPSRPSAAALEEQFRHNQQQFLAQLRGAAPAASGDQQLAANLSKQLNLDKTALPRGGSGNAPSGSEPTPFAPRPIVKTDEDDSAQMAAMRRRTQEVLSGGLALPPVGSVVRPMLGGNLRSVGGQAASNTNISVGSAPASNAATKNQIIQQQQQQQILALMQAKAILQQHQAAAAVSPHQTAVMQQMFSAATSGSNAAAALRHHQLQQFASQQQQQQLATAGGTESDSLGTAAAQSPLSRFLGMDSLRHQRNMPPLPSSDKAVTLDQVESR